MYVTASKFAPPEFQMGFAMPSTSATSTVNLRMWCDAERYGTGQLNHM